MSFELMLMDKERYSKSEMLRREILTDKQTKEQVMYYIFKDEELVYVGITNNFARRAAQHYSMDGDKKVLYKSMKKYGLDVFDIYIAEEFSYRNSAVEREKEQIRFFKGLGLARYNSENILENIHGTNIGIQPYTKFDAKEMVDVAKKRANIILKSAIDNIESNILEDILDYNSRELEMFLAYRISTLDKNKDKDRVIESNRYSNIYDYNDCDESFEYDYMAFHFDSIENTVEAMVDILSRIFYSSEVSTEIHEEYFNYAKDIIENVYENSPPIEQYIFALLFCGNYNIEDARYTLGMDEHEMNEYLYNILGEGLLYHCLHQTFYNEGVLHFDR